jgi:polyisoprenoid-binding protein YceI
MKTRLLSLALIAAASAATPAFAEPVTYTIDPTHTQIQFTWSHMGFSNITGRFDATEGTLVYDPANPAASSIQVSTQIASVTSGVAKLDEEIRDAMFLDAAQFPAATFKSTRVEAAGEGRLKVSGDLTIHGVTQPATFDVTVNKVGEHPMRKVPAAGFDATGTIDRTAFGVDKYTMATGPEIRLHITTEAHAAKE